MMRYVYCCIMSRRAVVLVLLVVLAPLSGATTVSGAPVALTVSVTDQSGDPIAGADLTATWENGSATAETTSNGKAFIDVPEDADVELEAEHPAYVRNHPVVVENATEQAVTVDMHQRGSATISVTDESGQVSDARVIIRKDGRIVEDSRTTSTGTFQTDVIEHGDYTVTVIKRGYDREQTEMTVDGDVEDSVAIERGSVTLSVRVVDPHFDPPRPIEGVTVSVDSVGQFTTQPEGTASVGVPVNSELDMTVTGENYEEVSQTVSVTESAVSVNVSTSRAPEISLESANERVIAGEGTLVTVRNEYDEPVEGATVLLDEDAVGETDANGQLTVTVSDPGNHSIVAERGELQSGSVTVTGVNVNGETPAPTEEPQTMTDSSGPGFGPVVALLALVVSALLGRRRQ
jgi:PGF-CTERM protein